LANKLSILSAAIKQKALDLGFSRVGIAIANPKLTPENNQLSDQLQAWLALGYHADMAWMASPKRQDLSQVMPSVQSVICVALNYYNPNPPAQDPKLAKISRYGWGRDYHRVLGKKLKAFCVWLESQESNQQINPKNQKIETRFYVDTGPIAEKAWAQRAGIGWIGKHSNLISREYGSWLFLGEVLTNLELEPDQPHAEHCGTCSRCIEACPTGAIAAPFVVDANRCIAYHTIENKAEVLPEPIATNLNNWVAGCDICQDVCPWNQRFSQPTKEPDFQTSPRHFQLEALSQMTESEWDQAFRGSALRRIKPHRLRRNAQAAIIKNQQF